MLKDVITNNITNSNRNNECQHLCKMSSSETCIKYNQSYTRVKYMGGRINEKN